MDFALPDDAELWFPLSPTVLLVYEMAGVPQGDCMPIALQSEMVTTANRLQALYCGEILYEHPILKPSYVELRRHRIPYIQAPSVTYAIDPNAQRTVLSFPDFNDPETAKVVRALGGLDPGQQIE